MTHSHKPIALSQITQPSHIPTIDNLLSYLYIMDIILPCNASAHAYIINHHHNYLPGVVKVNTYDSSPLGVLVGGGDADLFSFSSSLFLFCAASAAAAKPIPPIVDKGLFLGFVSCT